MFIFYTHFVGMGSRNEGLSVIQPDSGVLGHRTFYETQMAMRGPQIRGVSVGWKVHLSLPGPWVVCPGSTRWLHFENFYLHFINNVFFLNSITKGT